MKHRVTVLFLLFCSAAINAQSVPADSVTLYLAGDVTFAHAFERDISDSLFYPFAKMKWFGDADITMVNLENPITVRGTLVPKEFNFRTHPKYLRVLTDAGIDIVTLGNNHVYDYGDEGIFDSIHFLDSIGVKHVGAGMNEDSAREPVVIVVKGLRIGFLGYLGFIKTKSLHFASATTAGPAVMDIQEIQDDVARLKKETDYVVVNFHWGVEKSHVPASRQIEIAHQAVEAGADLIVGHHPHVVQGIERYKGKVIAYSLGNFLFGGNSRHTYSTAVLRVMIPVNASSNARVSVIPIHVERWQPYEAQGVEAKNILEEVKRYSRIFSDDIFRSTKKADR